MKIISASDIDAMEQRYRTTFINSLAGFKSLNLIGTKNQEGITNLALFNSIFHVGAHPPFLGMVFRPHEVQRHTLENILSTKYYTINQVNPTILNAAHQTSARYPKEISEFEACGLTPLYTKDITAPYVLESKVRIGLLLREKIDVNVNHTVIIIGQIIEVIVEEKTIHEDGFVDLEMSETLTVCGLDAYYKTTLLERLPYAKPTLME